MPLYDIRCTTCDIKREIFKTLKSMDDLPECCGKPMQRMVSAPMVMGDIQPYQSQIDGSMITSRSKHRDHLRRHGCIEIGNEKIKPKAVTPPPGLKQRLVEVASEKLR